MIDAFIDKIPYGAEENKFLLINTIFKRIKQLTSANVELPTPLTSEEIVDQAYGEIKDHLVRPAKTNGVVEDKPKRKKKLKEIVLIEKPVVKAGKKTTKGAKVKKKTGKK